MKDGYYLSTYIFIGKLANLMFPDIVLRHDQNMSLWKKKGKNVFLIKYWELERYSGLKHHEKSLYDEEDFLILVNNLLREVGLTIEDIVEIWGSPIISDVSKFKYDEANKLPIHSIAHLFSGMMLDTDIFKHEEIVGFAVDCGPDSLIDNGIKFEHHYSGGYSKSGCIQEVFPIISPGVLWAEATYLLGMQEGTLMALASASTSRLIGKELEFIHIEHIGISGYVRKILTELYEYCQNLKDEDIDVKFTGFDDRFSREENICSMIMKKINTLSCKIMEHNIDGFLERHDLDAKNLYLSITGGFGLNCPINSYLMRKYDFKGFMAPPCVSDTGLSLGLALIKFYYEEKDFNFRLENASYGYENVNIEIALKEFDSYIESVKYDIDYKEAVKDLINEPIIWIEGGAEIGPRALGCRSLLGDSRAKETKDSLNCIKQREWWRPVAPIVLYEYMDKWFEDCFESPYMLHTFTVKKDKVDCIPAITHLDDSARVQTVRENSDTKIAKLLNEFYKETGVPIICNTSLNDKGEPIINKLEEAINFALRKYIKVIYIDGVRIELKNHLSYKEKDPYKRSIGIKMIDEKEKERLIEQENPLKLHIEQVYRIYDMFGNKADFSLKDKNKIHRYIKVAEKFNDIIDKKISRQIFVH